MGDIKSKYTLAEAAEYLKRETETPELSVHDLVTLAAEGKLSVCFPYKGQLGLFKNDHHVGTPTVAEIAQSIFGRPVKSFYFNGILRSLSRPAPDNEITDLRGRTRKSHALHPVRVVPVCVFASDPPVELGESEGHHWRRVRGSKSSSAGAQFMAGIPEAEWMIEAESLHKLADARSGVASSTGVNRRPEPAANHSPTESKPSEPLRRVISTKARRNTLSPVIEQAQDQSSNSRDVAEVWGILSAMAEKKVPPLLGATEDGIQWLKNGVAAILTRKAIAERVRRQKPQ